MAEVPKESMRPEDMEFPSNAIKYRDKEEPAKNDIQKEEKAPKKALNGVVTEKKRSFAKQFVDIFFENGASPKEIKRYVIKDLLVPAILENIADTIQAVVEMRFFGETGRSARRGRKADSANGSNVRYGGYFVGNDDRRNRASRRLTRDPDDSYQEPLGDFIFDDRRDAEMVLVDMKELVDTYKRVTVADYIDLLKQYGVKVRDADHTDQKWGWTDLSDVGVKPARGGGHYIDLPKEYPL